MTPDWKVDLAQSRLKDMCADEDQMLTTTMMKNVSQFFEASQQFMSLAELLDKAANRNQSAKASRDVSYDDAFE